MLCFVVFLHLVQMNERRKEEKFDRPVRCCVDALFRFNGALRWNLDDPRRDLAVWTRL